MRARPFLLLLPFAVVVAACGGSSTGDLGGSLNPDGGGDGDNGDGSLEVPDGGFILDIGPQDTAIDPDAACAAQSFDAKQLPPNLLLLFDRSGSMNDKAGAQTKWAGAIAAITTLVKGSPDNWNVGLEFFPPTKKFTDVCDPTLYATPNVDIAPLSTSRAPIECWLGTQATGTACGTIKATAPGNGGGTPMEPAVASGIVTMAKVTDPGGHVVVLITDGDPNGCGDINSVITAAQAAPTSTPPIAVYVIGAPGGTVANLSQVAAAGNGKRTPTCVANTTDATQACEYQIGSGNFEADLTAALQDIAGKALTCVFDVPPATSGTVDPTLVNVDVTTGGSTSTLPKDPTHANGWDYTDGGKTITIYGPTCDQVKSDPAVKVQILLGCKTKVPA